MDEVFTGYGHLLALDASVTAQDKQGKIAPIAAAYQNNLSDTDLLIPA